MCDFLVFKIALIKCSSVWAHLVFLPKHNYPYTLVTNFPRKEKKSGKPS